MRNYTLLVWAGVVGGAAALGAGAWIACVPGHGGTDGESAAMATLMDAGRALERDIGRVVRPAMARTREIASDPATLAAIRSGDRAAQTALVNRAVTRATEIDAIALFNAQGKISAINTVYASGAPIEASRVERIIGMDFDNRDIIQRCVKNQSETDVLEFQTTCDITPAFFDSTGLSVAYSVPVLDPSTGARAGVASSRLRFDRLSDLVRERSIGGASGSFQFVTDAGAYFSEEINSGRLAAPIPSEDLRPLVRPGDNGETISRWKDRFVCIFPLKGFKTLDGGGIHVMAEVPDTWIAREALQARLLRGAAVGGVGLLLLLLAVTGKALLVAERAREETEKAREATEVASRAKSDFLANMSHEIRTPMTAILGYAELLEEPDQSDKERVERIRAIRRSGDHLLGVINDVLDLAKIEAGKMTVERSRCSICGIVAEVAAMMRVRAAGKGIRLEVEYVFPVPETVESDGHRVRQILINLVGNAVKFTEHGEVRIRVRSERMAAGNPTMLVEVRDSGIGMSEAQQRAIFQPFNQGDNSMSRRFGGTGLGLTISRRLARMLGGDITVHSAPEQGSVFTLALDVGRLEGVRMIENATETVLPESGSGPRKDVRVNGRILLAEDGPDNQRLISFLLRRAGADVEIAANGKLAVDAVMSASAMGRPFGLVLMDMQMPEMDGYQATQELRRLGVSMPIVALTAHALRGEQEKCLTAGCDGYASKPIDRQALLELCADWLAGETMAAAA